MGIFAGIDPELELAHPIMLDSIGISCAYLGTCCGLAAQYLRWDQKREVLKMG
jgi:hypothetical protein